MKILVCLSGALICLVCCSYGQVDSTAMMLAKFPNRIFAKINSKASSLDDALTKQTEKYLQRLARKEKKIQDHLYKLDSNAAKNLFNGTQAKYAALESSMTNSVSANGAPLTGEYLPYVDSLKSSISFSQKNPALLNVSPKVQAQINASLAQFNQLQNNFTNADQVKAYIQQRKQAFKDQLQQYMQNSAMKKYLDQYNQQVYYYSQQVREYKETLNDPDLMLQKALVILNKIPAFTHFIQQNGQLAGLFGIPNDYGTAAGLVGLQTRDQVQQLMNGQISAGGAGGMAAFQSNLETAHDQLDQFKDKLAKLGGGSGDIDMPDFKPNNQKTKSLMQRLELGINLQTTRANSYFPSTTALGISLGYLVSNKTTIGIGGSYSLGWGSGINHIHFSNQGISFRSFIDFKIGKTLYISGGFEENFVTPFTNWTQLQTQSMWQRSGLIGLSKMVSLPGKVVKKTKVSILWDFLSYYQIPPSQAFVFRVGYNF
jgi:ATP-dependent protease HslVU (ClpYQ) peptidase subunit